uniref:non-specific serine/threonine protein kinase n=1 Tax=Denticeps clupeoides TaxID=299321 RepID=A0AAY4BRP8_9TELE
VKLIVRKSSRRYGHHLLIMLNHPNSLGEGSSGLVFKAVKNLTGQMAAVKVIDVKEKTPKKEVEFMQNTKHRNITKLLEIYLWKDQLYICMEHCNGGTLWDLCYETGSLTELEIAYVTKQCLQALHYMHGRGYMHRDIKLENIFLTFTGEVKIGDFGAIDRMENLPHEVAGTAETRAPEVSKVGERGSYDEKCDIWSLGISLLDLAECMSLVTYKPDEVYQSWTTIAKNQWSEDFKSFVRAALTVDPARRRLNGPKNGAEPDSGECSQTLERGKNCAWEIVFETRKSDCAQPVARKKKSLTYTRNRITIHHFRSQLPKPDNTEFVECRSFNPRLTYTVQCDESQTE